MRYLILAGVLIAVASPAHAQSRCHRPYAPNVNITPQTTPAEFARIGVDIRAFISASDIYQTCLTSRNAPADAGRLIIANQAEKQRLGSIYHAALRSRR